jgi:cellulose synthase/poly-beta-1,6-N-acetylglucosamine synthase-like glycosyltransferase
MIYLFWLFILILVYHILGYGLLLSFINLFKKQDNTAEWTEFPSITVLCPAYNEESVIEEKIKSFIDLDYPKDKINMIVISDDSTDRTNEIVNKYTKDNNIKLVVQKPRKGKQSGHNLVEPSIITDYVLSTDANSIFHQKAIKELVKTMKSDDKIGIVSGELKLLKDNNKDSGEGYYWKYESWLKCMESKFHTIIGANGSIFLIKRKYFTQIHPASVDDFERALIILKKGLIVKYNPKAIVYENVTQKATEEINRKIRIIAQEWFALFRQKAVFTNTRIAFLLFSHKIIRWLLPLFSIFILISNCFLFYSTFFIVIFIGQLLVYILGILELILETKRKTIKPLKMFAYYTAMNYAAFMALIKFMKGKQYATWNTIREEK